MQFNGFSRECHNRSIFSNVSGMALWKAIVWAIVLYWHVCSPVDEPYWLTGILSYCSSSATCRLAWGFQLNNCSRDHLKAFWWSHDFSCSTIKFKMCPMICIDLWPKTCKTNDIPITPTCTFCYVPISECNHAKLNNAKLNISNIPSANIIC